MSFVNNRPLVFVVLVLLGGAGMALTRGPDDDAAARKALEQAHQLMAGKDYGAAIKVLEAVSGNPTTSLPVRRVRLLEARALRLTGETASSAEKSRKLLELLKPEQAGYGRARWLLADAFEAEGKMNEAAREWAAMAADVVSDTQSTLIAGYYLRLAAEVEKAVPGKDALDPGKKAQPAKAAAFRLRALQELSSGPQVTPRPEITLNRAQNLLDSNNPTAAPNELTALLKLPGLKQDQRTQALLLRAASYLAGGPIEKSVVDLQAVLKLPSVEESPVGATALSQLGAAFHSMASKSAHQECIEVSERFLRKYPSHPEAVDVRIRIAESYTRSGESEQAAKAWTAVSETKAATRNQRADAAWRVGELYKAISNYAAAETAYASYLREYPDHSSVPAAQTARALLLLHKADGLHAEERPLEAVAVYRTWLERYPLHPRAAITAVGIGQILRGEKKFDEAETALRVARERYERHAPDQAARAGYLLGVMAEEDRLDLPQAVALYRAVVEMFPNTAAAQAVRGRLMEMEGIQISAECPRAFHPKEPAVAKLTLRNVKEVTLRLYKLNAKSYFERKGTLQGADKAEIALVKADRTWTYRPAKFERYLKWEHDLPLALKADEPLPEGAYLLSVEAEKRRAVVMVLVSSLRVVVKQSPYEVFCWVVDAATGEPRQGVELLVRDNGLRETLISGEDGVARLKHESPQFSCRVLAVEGGSVAAGQSHDLPKLETVGLVPRASFTFDSSIYRPGATVRWQATLRDVEKETFVPFAKGTEAKVGLRSPTGRLLAQPSQRVREFGVIFGEMALPKNAALGQWSLEVQIGKQSFQEKLAVREYRAPDILVNVEPELRHLREGQEVSIEVAANYTFGGGVAEAEFEWALFAMPMDIDRSQYLDYAWFLQALAAQGRPAPAQGNYGIAQGRGRLGVQGKGRFTITGPAAPKPMRYLVQVKVNNKVGQWVAGSSSVTGGPRDRFGVVIANQKTYRVGDKAKVRVLTRLLNGQPANTAGRLRVLHRSRILDGRWVLIEKASLNVDTGLRGESVLNVPLETAGPIVLELSAKDGLGVPFIETTEVLVTGKEADFSKEARLRFEREAYRAGTMARVHLDVPVLNRPVLLTFEAASVTEYRIYRPKLRSEVIEVLLDQKHAPNVVLSCSLPGVEKLYTSEDRIAVMRYLETKITAPKGAKKPGDAVNLKLETRDQSGKPLAAALSVRAVDRALAGLQGQPMQDPRWVFNRDLKPHLVRTTSTFDFEFKGVTEFMDPDLLARFPSPSKWKNAALRKPVLETSSKDMKSVIGNNLYRLDRARTGGGGGGGGNKVAHISGLTLQGGRAQDKRIKQELELGVQLSTSAFVAPARSGGVDNGQPGLPAAASFSPSSGLFYNDGSDGDIRGRFDYSILPSEPVLRERFVEVALWAPYVLTNDSGSGALSFTLPDNLTTWDIETSGVSGSTHAGLAQAQVEVRKDVVARIETPRFLRTGDEIMAKASVISRLGEVEAFQIEAKSLTSGILELIGASEHRAEVPANGERSMRVQWQARGSGQARLEVKARSAQAGDAQQIDLSVLPFGKPWRVVDEAQLIDRADFSVVIPRGRVTGSESYRIVLGGGANSGEDLLKGLAYCISYPYGCVEQTVNRFLPAMLLAEMRSQKGLTPLMDPARQKELVERGLAELRGLQRNDGSFGYWGGSGDSLSWTTALVLVACSHAERLGYAYDSALKVSAMKASRAVLASASVGIEARAALAHALALAGQAPLVEMRSLWRARGRLSASGMAKLLLAYDAAGEGGMRQRLWNDLQTKVSSIGKPMRRIGRNQWPMARLESLALYLQAAAAASAPLSELRDLGREVRALMRTREGGTKAIAEALVALGGLQSSESERFDQAKIRILIDGKPISLPKVTDEGSSIELASMFQTYEIPKAMLSEGKHVVSVQQEGAGSRLCRLSLQHVQAADSVSASGNAFSVTRRVTEWQDPKQASDGFRPGWSVVKAEARPTRQSAPSLQQAAVGEKVTVELEVSAHIDSSFLAIVEPLMAGLSPISESVVGGTGRFERRASELLFFPRTLKKGQTLRIRYGAFVTHTGTFRAPPARVFEMYAPRNFGHSDSLGLQVFPNATRLARMKSPEITPDERFGLAQRYVEGKEKSFEAALVHLKELSTLELEDESLNKVLALETKAALRTQAWKLAAASFEELERRRPGSFGGTVEERRLLGQAYLAIGDSAMARRHFQQVVERGSRRWAKPGRAIAAVRGLATSIRFREKARLRYPLSSDVQVEGLGLGQQWLQVSTKSSSEAKDLPEVWSLGWRQALSNWASVAAWDPQSKEAEDAGRLRIELFQDLGLTKSVVQEAKAWLVTYGQSSRDADKVVFMLAQTFFQQEKWDRAAAAAKDLYDSKWPKAGSKKPVWSAFRSQAALLLGRIAHVQGRVEDAVKWYATVKGIIPEAEQSWRFFREEALSAPVVVTIPTKAEASVTFTAKNVKALHVGLYPVDIGVLFSVKKRFESLRKAELTGLDPIRTLKVQATRASHLEQPLRAELGTLKPGAWLVLGQSESQAASSLLIVSDANLSVQHSAGYVRVALSDAQGKPVANAQVTVAAQGSILHRGRTDERGMMAVEASTAGPVTVVAEQGDLVAVRTVP